MRMNRDPYQQQADNDPYRNTESPYPVKPNTAPPSMHDLLSVFWRRRGLMALCIVVITTAAAVASLSMTRQYRATSQVLLTPDQTDVINETQNEEKPQQTSTEIETYTRLIKSRSFAETVIERLDLTKDPFFNPVLAKNEPSKPNIFLELLDQVLQTSLAPQTGFAGSNESDPLGDVLADRLAFDGAVSRLISGLSVQQDGLSSIISLSFTSTNPGQSASVANAVAELFVNERLRDRRSGSEEATDWLEKRVEELRQKVVESERAIAQFRIENKIIDAGSGPLSDAEVSQINNNLIISEAKTAEKETKLNILRRALEQGDGLASITEVTASPAIAAIRQQEFNVQSTEAQLREELGPNHPRVLEVEAEKRRLKQKTRLEVEKIVAVLTNEWEISKKQSLTLRTQLESARENLGVRNKAEVELAEREREAQANRDLYTRFLNRLKFLNEEQALIGSGARIVSRAIPPTKPSFPQPSVIFVAGFIASVLSGGLIALVREGLERGLRHSRQVEQTLGLPTLGMVPEMKAISKKQSLHHYIRDKPLSGYAESVRNIQVALQYGWVSRRTQIILVTSSLPNEGKTTLALSLATSMAIGGNSTLLIDLDFRNPSVGEQMGSVRDGTSIITYLNGDKSWEETLHSERDIDGLSIIPGSGGITNPVHCLESYELRNFLEEMRGEFDHIILDAPPVLGISDTCVAVRLADAVLLAAKWGDTKVDVAQNTVETLARHEAPVAGVVLTQIDVKKHAKLAFGDAAQHYKSYQRYYID